MATLVAVQDVAFAQFRDAFGDLQPDVLIVYEGDDFDEATREEAWVQVSLVPGDEFAASIPPRRRRQQGLLTVQIFTPSGLGSQPGLIIANSALVSMNGFRMSGVRFQGVRRPERIGNTGRWFQYNVNMPFETDTIT